uniref:Uncharacterized protein n=1 Tax=Salarias fasciatus TaxID=181472 RepID=A0A672FV62_SALFA
MPICWVMWSQVPGVPRACSLAFSWSLISRTRSAMVFTLSFLEGNQTRSSGQLRVVLTIFSIWDRMRVRFSLSRATTVRFPTLSSENGALLYRATKSSKPSDTKKRIAQASLSRLPEAKPWYAESKNTKRFLLWGGRTENQGGSEPVSTGSLSEHGKV